MYQMQARAEAREGATVEEGRERVVQVEEPAAAESCCRIGEIFSTHLKRHLTGLLWSTSS